MQRPRDKTAGTCDVFPSVTDDPEGDALEREIAQDRVQLGLRRRRRVLFLPPLFALGVAAWALGVSRPREVFGARIYAGGLPGPQQPLRARVEVVRAVPGIEGAWASTSTVLRPVADGARGRADVTDDRGISELTIDAPLPPRVTVEAQLPDGRFSPIGELAIAALRPADPSDGKLALRRTSGAVTGDFKIAVAPELSALAPPVAGAVWIRVRDAKGAPIPAAAITLTAEGGLAGDPAPTVTDAGGLARVALTPIAAPIVLGAKVEKDGKTATWTGIVGSVLGAPRPTGDGRMALGARSVELVASASHGSAYWDLWQSGVRIAGGRVAFSGGRATIALPDGLAGVLDLETNAGPFPPSADDLNHAATFPLVLAKDDVDAWGTVSTSPRFEDVLPSSGSLASYGTAVAATIAFAAPAIPARVLVEDSIGRAVQREFARSRTVRRAATTAVIGGGLLELGLLFALGVLGAPPTVAEALHELGDAPKPKPQSRARQLVGFLLVGVGIIALIFASLATMAWGLP